MRESFRLHFALVAAAVFAVTLFGSPARAAFHLWGITEVYSNSSGSLQFIEMRDTSGGQNFVGGTQIQVTNAAGTLTNTFTIPSNLGGNTFNHSLLFGTAGIQAAGGPAPDFILPSNFLFTGGGTITFFGSNGGTYSALPIDGVRSMTWPAGTATNTPTNYAGQTGTIPAPAGLSVAAAGAWFATRRRRSV